MKSITRASLAFCLSVGFAAGSRADVVTFEDLRSPPATDSLTGLSFANGGSPVYRGVTWDSRVFVVGDGYRVDTTTPGPLFGIPHSGHYFITNGGADNDGILLTTDQVLLGAWFSRNEYYGFGSGADQVTINALSGSTVLASVIFDLPAPSVAGQPGRIGFADTSSFAALTGITGYRIDRHELGTQSGNWVADDFSFAVTSVPEPSSGLLLVVGLLMTGGHFLIGAGCRHRGERAEPDRSQIAAVAVPPSTTTLKIGAPPSQIEPSSPAAPCMLGRWWS